MSDSLDRLCGIMDRLRDPGGCPWDRKQTLSSLAPYLLEEAHEVADAIAADEPAKLREELGDLLLQIVFMARVGRENGWFDATWTTCCEGLTHQALAIVKERC